MRELPLVLAMLSGLFAQPSFFRFDLDQDNLQGAADYPLGPDGARLAAMAAAVENGVARFTVNGEGAEGAPWFEIVVER